MRTIPKFCITGGPCSGKTSAKAYLSEKLPERGFHPIFVPEAATLVMSSNIKPAFWDRRDFQTLILKTMVSLEDSFVQAAESRRDLNPVVICDRGAAEVKVYAPNEADWKVVISASGFKDFVELRDKRYDAVFHMVTAANGAEKFYTLENNAERKETPQRAREIDLDTQDAWTGATHLRIIDNNVSSFDEKLKRLEREICAVLGIPVPLEIEKKYLCKRVDFGRLPKGAQHIDIEQVYLQAPGGDQLRVRKRGQNGAYTYYQTEKRQISSGVREEKERQISAEQYGWSLPLINPDTNPLRKTRTCFVYESQYFELDVIPRPDGMLYLLEIELTDQASKVSLPPFITIERDVTDEREFTNFQLAKKAV